MCLSWAAKKERGIPRWYGQFGEVQRRVAESLRSTYPCLLGRIEPRRKDRFQRVRVLEAVVDTTSPANQPPPQPDC